MNINDEVRYLGQTWTIYAMDGDCCYLEGTYHEEQTMAEAEYLELVRGRYGDAAARRPAKSWRSFTRLQSSSLTIRKAGAKSYSRPGTQDRPI